MDTDDLTLEEYLCSSSDEEIQNGCNNELPIDNHKYDILDHIDKYRVTCIHGQTGSGKSTRVPQYLVQQYQQAKSWGVHPLEAPRIVITQPRRIAAKSLAKRVAQEMGEKDVGQLVGYKIGQDQRAGDNTMICYVTSGYLIELLVHNCESFDQYTHIILDEIHERNLDADLLSLVIKLLMDKYSRCKLIIMSATLQANLFLRYFCPEYSYQSGDHVLFVGVESPYDVTTVYIEDVYGYCQDNNLKISQETMKQIIMTYSKFSEVTRSQLLNGDDSKTQDSVAFEKMEEVVAQCKLSINDNRRRNPIHKPANTDKKKEVKPIDNELRTGVFLVQTVAVGGASILIFLPGIREIEEMYDLLLPYEENQFKDGGCNLTVFTLHSKMPHEDQQECFREPDDTCHVILATNIAESSITLPSVNVIIDFGQRRHVAYDPVKRLSCLKLDWCSQASMKQRKGRTGRVCDGVCFRIMTQEHFLSLIEFDEAQMRLSPLDKLILQVKYMGGHIAAGQSPSQLLQQAVEPPASESVYTAVKNLADIGALTNEDENSDVTLLGKFCMDMPMDINLCRLVFFGALFCCPADAAVMAAAIHCQDPFKQPSNKVFKDQEKFVRAQKTSSNSRRRYDNKCYSEPILYRNLLRDWLQHVEYEEQYRCEYQLNNKGAKQKKSKKKYDMKTLRRGFGRDNDIDAKRLELFEGMVSDVAYSLLKWLPSHSDNRTQLQKLIDTLPRNRKPARTVDKPECEEWKPIAGNSEVELFTDDVLLLNMLLASAFVPKFVYGSVKLEGARKPGPDRMEKLKTNMIKLDIEPERSVCIPKPEDFWMRSDNEEAVRYMIKTIGLQHVYETQQGTHKRQREDDRNRFKFNGKEQMFIEFNSASSQHMGNETDKRFKVTSDVHPSVANVFYFTEGASGRDKKIKYHFTRLEDLKLKKGEPYIDMSLPENPYRINWQLMSSNGTSMKSNGKFCKAGCNRWRNPTGYVCDVEQRPHYGVVAGITAGQHGDRCWVDGMSLFPIYKRNLFAVTAMLAFLPHQHGAKFTIKTDNMTIAKVSLFDYDIDIYDGYELTSQLVRILNNIRKETSQVFRDFEAKKVKKIPDCNLRHYYDQLIEDMRHSRSTEEPGRRQSRPTEEPVRRQSNMKPYEVVNGCYNEGCYAENDEYLKPYNTMLLFNRKVLYKYVNPYSNYSDYSDSD